MFIRLWLDQNLFYINSSSFKQTKITRCWFKSNSRNRICWTIKKKLNSSNSNVESKFTLTILEKMKEKRLKFSQGTVTLL